MSKIEKSIEVNVPLRTAYGQWTQFEEFPRFMEGVEYVRQLDDQRLAWKAKIAGKAVEWIADIYEQVPDRRIAWRSTSGAKNEGSVSFASLGEARTRITLALDVDPATFGEKVGDAFGAVSSRVEGDLERFKKFIEARGRETGAWRGEIHGDHVQKPSSPSANF
jgi:uncharacterized membrane protein